MQNQLLHCVLSCGENYNVVVIVAQEFHCNPRCLVTVCFFILYKVRFSHSKVRFGNCTILRPRTEVMSPTL